MLTKQDAAEIEKWFALVFVLAVCGAIFGGAAWLVWYGLKALARVVGC